MTGSIGSSPDMYLQSRNDKINDDAYVSGYIDPQSIIQKLTLLPEMIHITKELEIYDT